MKVPPLNDIPLQGLTTLGLNPKDKPLFVVGYSPITQNIAAGLHMVSTKFCIFARPRERSLLSIGWD
jgi:hypothetical protein